MDDFILPRGSGGTQPSAGNGTWVQGSGWTVESQFLEIVTPVCKNQVALNYICIGKIRLLAAGMQSKRL